MECHIARLIRWLANLTLTLSSLERGSQRCAVRRIVGRQSHCRCSDQVPPHSSHPLATSSRTGFHETCLPLALEPEEPQGAHCSHQPKNQPRQRRPMQALAQVIKKAPCKIAKTATDRQ